VSEAAIAVYRDESVTLEIRLDEGHETVWLTQEQIATLFGVNVPAISKHIKNIYNEQELEPSGTLSKMEIVREEGGRQVLREIAHYNLDMVISVGYRVSSKRATRFRQWATQILKAYVTKGYAVNEIRLGGDLLAKLAEVESRLTNHDHQIRLVLDAIRQMMAPPGGPARRIGFRTGDGDGA
jgi:hypothetical protein